METAEKLTELLPLKISPSMGDRLTRYAGSERKRADFVRTAITEKFSREAKRRRRMPAAVSIPPAEARALAVIRSKGGNVLEILEAVAEAEQMECPVLPHIKAAIADAATAPRQVGLPAVI